VFLLEPPRTQYDLQFSLAGVPVRVHPFFWVVTILLGMGSGASTPPKQVLIWMIAVFASIVVHEFGHALAIRYYGWRPRIILYSFGGLAAYEPTYRDRRAQIVIALAGPAAGFIFAAAILAGIVAAGHEVRFRPDFLAPFAFEIFDLENLNILIFDLLYVNIAWGLLNLLPIYPLDGGKVAQEALTFFNPRDGMRQSLLISIVAAVGVGIALYMRQNSFYALILFGMLAFSNYQMLQAYGNYGGRGW
jgi:stage IV sporulation protein FB